MAVGDGFLSIVTLTVIGMVLGSSASVAYGRDGHHLHVEYYKNTCPQAENIIREAVKEAVTSDPSVAASLVRLQFHDCFVNGCDASILLEETPSREPVELTSPSNVGVRGLEVIDKAKTRLEKECPGRVSCADIVAFAARDASVASGIGHYLVPAGRRDGLASRAIDTKGNLPRPSSNVSVMVDIFNRKGLNLHDLVTLLGSHSFGVSHCSSFNYRLYNFSQIETMDPQLDELFALTLKLACPKVDERDHKVHFDYITPNRLDNFYYWRILNGKGLLFSDQALLEDPDAREIVARMAFDPDYWNTEFGKAMIKLGRIDVLTGTQGQIRRQCRFVNK